MNKVCPSLWRFSLNWLFSFYEKEIFTPKNNGENRPSLEFCEFI